MAEELQVTQADREAAASLLGFHVDSATALNLLNGTSADGFFITQAFARHREEGYRQGIEAAAMVAKEYLQGDDFNSMDCDIILPDRIRTLGGNRHADPLCKEAAAQIDRLTTQAREQAMQYLALDGQAMDLQAEVVRLREARDEIDEWCRNRCKSLEDEMAPHIERGGDLDDRIYRAMLGEHRGYMHVRSFISGMRQALATKGG